MRTRLSKPLGDAILTVFLGFHLFVAAFVPNSQTPLGARIAPWLDPYVSSLELSNLWEFFAPNPSAAVYVDWELLDRGGNAIGRGSLPSRQVEYALRDRHNRRAAAAMFLTLGPDERIEKMMLPWLCGSDSRVSAVRLWKTAYSPPSMEEVRAGARRIGDGRGEEKRFVSMSFCGEARG